MALIAGPTASGKSALALAAAERWDGVIVNADSAQLYRDLPILSAAPGRDDRGRADHRPCGLAQGPDETDRLFHGPGLCLKSLACGVTGGDWATFSVHDLPSEWFGDVEHTHRAIDDARGYANLLVEVMRRARG